MIETDGASPIAAPAIHQRCASWSRARRGTRDAGVHPRRLWRRPIDSKHQLQQEVP